MTNEEFNEMYAKLKSEFPGHFSGNYKREIIAKYVKDLSAVWFSRIVDKIILSSDPRFDFEDAARGERQAINQVKLTQNMLQIMQADGSNCTEQGLSDFLKQTGCRTLGEALDKISKKVDE